MRITNSMLSKNYLDNLHRTMGRMSRYQQQLATSKRITRLSDDPVGAIATLSVRGKLTRLEQYQRNIDDARAWLTQSETSVMELNDIIKTLYEKTVQAANGTNGAPEKQAIATQIKQLRDHIFQLANTSLGDKYIFGGYQTNDQPFTLDGGVLNYQGLDLAALTPAQDAALKDQAIMVEIGSGLHSSISVSGASLMGTGEGNLYSIINDLTAVLEANATPDQISPFIARLQDKQEETLALVTEIGGRINRLDLVTARYKVDELNYQTVQSQVEDIDMSEVIMQFKMTESVYTAALSVGSRVIVPSLVDFLR